MFGCMLQWCSSLLLATVVDKSVHGLMNLCP